MAVSSDQTLANPVVLLTGASSQIGVFAIPRLVQAGFRVLAVTRKRKPAGYPSFSQVKWLNEVEALRVVENCQFLLSAGPMELAAKFLHAQPKFKSAVVFSSSSVESKRESGSTAERDQMQAMLELELRLQRLAQNSNTKLLIFRPTLVYGCGLDTNISRLAAWIRRFGFLPVNGRAKGLRQPVHADDLAAVAISAMRSEQPLPPVLYVPGGETLSYSEMAGRVFAALGKPPRLIRLPESLLMLLAGFTGVLRISDINTEMVKRQNVDLVFDDREARELLGYDPRPFAPAESDFSIPEF